MPTCRQYFRTFSVGSPSKNSQVSEVDPYPNQRTRSISRPRSSYPCPTNLSNTASVGLTGEDERAGTFQASTAWVQAGSPSGGSGARAAWFPLIVRIPLSLSMVNRRPSVFSTWYGPRALKTNLPPWFSCEFTKTQSPTRSGSRRLFTLESKFRLYLAWAFSKASLTRGIISSNLWRRDILA